MRPAPVARGTRVLRHSWACWAVAAALLGGCSTPPPPAPPPAPAPQAPQTYVVLLPDADGTVGKVEVRGAQGNRVLSQPLQGSAISGEGEAFTVSHEQLARDFGAALAARPPLPEHFVLYFDTGGTRLAPQSQALLARVLQRAQARENVDVSVIGHTDTAGTAEANAALGYQRALMIANQLRQQGLKPASLTVETHGESNLLVPTPDETPEARNRRVEITLR